MWHFLGCSFVGLLILGTALTAVFVLGLVLDKLSDWLDEKLDTEHGLLILLAGLAFLAGSMAIGSVVCGN